MTVLVVVDNPNAWPLDVPGTAVVAAREYLTDPRFVALKRAKVFNLCRSYGYQSVGYYVSLLATARGHRAVPSVATVQGLRQSSLVRIASEELDGLIQKALAPIRSAKFDLSIYFGRNMTGRYDRLCQALFNGFPAPLLRAEFVRTEQTWRLHALRLIAYNEIPEPHREFLQAQLLRFFESRQSSRRFRPRYELAILVNPDEVDAPSDERAIRNFVKAAKRLEIAAVPIDKHHYGRIAEYDALFIRETTAVNHHTYRFARRAEAEGLVVIDDPESIVRCTNKVYQAELFERHRISAPKTLVVHKDNAASVADVLGLPCVLKQPDSSFSAGVVKAHTAEELESHLQNLLSRSELVVAQEFARSDFDWRVGVLGGQALYVCKYHMAKGHWQIQKASSPTERKYGKVETLAVQDAPRDVVELGVQTANLVGNGLYGVDIKEFQGRLLVVEVNDNPSVEAGFEDAVIKDALYDEVMAYFREQLDRRVQGMGT